MERLKKYEYATWFTKSLSDRHGKPNMDKFNELGDLGWELVHILEDQCFFKREVPPPTSLDLRNVTMTDELLVALKETGILPEDAFHIRTADLPANIHSVDRPDNPYNEFNQRILDKLDITLDDLNTAADEWKKTRSITHLCKCSEPKPFSIQEGVCMKCKLEIRSEQQ